MEGKGQKLSPRSVQSGQITKVGLKENNWWFKFKILEKKLKVMTRETRDKRD